MKIAIFGAGMAGTYLAKLLRKEGITYTLFDKRDRPSCFCAWGWAGFRQVKEFAKAIGYNADEYVLVRPKRAWINGVEVKIKNVVTFDKIKWLEDMWKDEVIVLNHMAYDPAEYDLVVDATGTARAVMGKSEYDRLLHTIQFKAKSSILDEDYIYVYGRPYGYAWYFPLGDGWWHIGAGAYVRQQADYLLRRILEEVPVLHYGDACQCAAKIRYVVPGAIPIVDMHPYPPKVAIGEAGGFVSGFGEGNTLAMETATVLYECIRDYPNNSVLAANEYKKRVLEKTLWVGRQYRFVWALSRGFVPALLVAKDVIKIANWRSIEISKWQALRILWKITHG
ncbi:NAD(P)/FAD-dependent oxidoreductase [Candidatus Aerophobetes bacterium]|nr:NAD(P)/FAD-dependent oxidoreductase [Candidatus Aerophobetes bacterium]